MDSRRNPPPSRDSGHSAHDPAWAGDLAGKKNQNGQPEAQALDGQRLAQIDKEKHGVELPNEADKKSQESVKERLAALQQMAERVRDGLGKGAKALFDKLNAGLDGVENKLVGFSPQDKSTFDARFSAKIAEYRTKVGVALEKSKEDLKKWNESRDTVATTIAKALGVEDLKEQGENWWRDDAFDVKNKSVVWQGGEKVIEVGKSAVDAASRKVAEARAQSALDAANVSAEQIDKAGVFGAKTEGKNEVVGKVLENKIDLPKAKSKQPKSDFSRTDVSGISSVVIDSKNIDAQTGPKTKKELFGTVTDEELDATLEPLNRLDTKSEVNSDVDELPVIVGELIEDGTEQTANYDTQGKQLTENINDILGMPGVTLDTYKKLKELRTELDDYLNQYDADGQKISLTNVQFESFKKNFEALKNNAEQESELAKEFDYTIQNLHKNSDKSPAVLDVIGRLTDQRNEIIKTFPEKEKMNGYLKSQVRSPNVVVDKNISKVETKNTQVEYEGFTPEMVTAIKQKLRAERDYTLTADEPDFDRIVDQQLSKKPVSDAIRLMAGNDPEKAVALASEYVQREMEQPGAGFDLLAQITNKLEKKKVEIENEKIDKAIDDFEDRIKERHAELNDLFAKIDTSKNRFGMNAKKAFEDNWARTSATMLDAKNNEFSLQDRKTDLEKSRVNFSKTLVEAGNILAYDIATDSSIDKGKRVEFLHQNKEINNQNVDDKLSDLMHEYKQLKGNFKP